ncbi:transcobalamin-2 [Osmerus eperlanus]|uniref:transcobalamin-2 n=1 Tax=Osmerus eperlanus TaxID=29151 RepID=UPI002E144162
MYVLYILSGLLALASSKPCETAESDHSELLLSLNKKLLRSLEDQVALPNPSVHLALRLSTHHNLDKESKHLNALKTRLHDDIESSLSRGQAVSGRLALYVLALKASCYDLSSLTFTLSQKSETLLTHLKRQMEQEKEHIAFSHRPLTTYYQYSLGVLALCVSGVRVNTHVSNKLIKAVEHGHIKNGDFDCIDSLAMAGMALQCVKNAGLPDQASLDQALATIRNKLLTSRRADGHIGNEYSTGLAVQALLAMGSQVEECAASMTAMMSDARGGCYSNPMAVSQTLPALQHTSYLQVKDKQCRDEDGSLVLEPGEPVVVLPSRAQVGLQVEVVKSNGAAAVFQVDVPAGSSLLDALELLQQKNQDFTFKKEDSLWGPFLSVVNKENARQTDRRYWQLSSDGAALSHGIVDFKIEKAQHITIRNAVY